MSKPKLKIQVIGAKALILRGKDARSGNAQPEVFCIMEFGKEKFATLSKPTQKSVVWNETAEFNLDLPTDEQRYVILKVLQKNTGVLSLEDDLFLGQVAVCLKEYVQGWDPEGHVRKNNFPLTSKHGKTNKDRGFLEFKIAFTNLNKQSSTVSKLGVGTTPNTNNNNKQLTPQPKVETQSSQNSNSNINNTNTENKPEVASRSGRNNSGPVGSSRFKDAERDKGYSSSSGKVDIHINGEQRGISNLDANVPNHNQTMTTNTTAKTGNLAKQRWRGSFRNLSSAITGSVRKSKREKGIDKELSFSSQAINTLFRMVVLNFFYF